MSGFKSLCLAFSIALCWLSACSTPKVFFNEAASLDTVFLKDIEASEQIEVSSVTIYKTSFRSMPVESRNVVEYAMFNEHAAVDTVSFLPAKGKRQQDLYLLQLNTAEGIYYAYFSIWYQNGQSVGYGPAYFGLYNKVRRTIEFKRDLQMRTADDGLYLKVKRGKGRGFYFTLRETPAATLDVGQIVLVEDNKIGGSKPYVFNIRERFGNISFLSFRRVENVTINHYSDGKK